MNVKSVTKDWLIIYPNVQKYYASQKMGFCGLWIMKFKHLLWGEIDQLHCLVDPVPARAPFHQHWPEAQPGLPRCVSQSDGETALQAEAVGSVPLADRPVALCKLYTMV